MADFVPDHRISDWAMLRRLITWAGAHQWRLWWSLTLIPLVVLCGVAQPYILGVAIDDYMLGEDLVGLGHAALIFLAVVVLEYIFGGLQMFLIMTCGIRCVGALRRGVYRHVMRQGQSFFDRRPIGSLLSRTVSDVDAVAEALSTGVVGIVTDVVRLLGIVVTMLWLDWRLTLVSFAVMPVVAVVVQIVRRQLRDVSTRIRIYIARINGYMQDHLAGVEMVQLHQGEARAAAEFSELNRVNVRATHHSNLLDATLYAVMDGVSSICIAMVVWYGGVEILENVGDTSVDSTAYMLTPGLLVAFVEYIQKALIPVKEFSGKYATLQRTMAALERIFGLLDTHQEITDGSSTLDNPKGHIRFEGVSYRYPETDVDVLSDVSFEIKPGQVVAVVGSTGSGKSTVCRLLTRAYDGYRGSITLDGVEMGDLEASQLRQQIAVVHQDVFLFNASVRFNVALGDDTISDEIVWQALDIAEARSFVQSLPGELGATISERGSNLSSGQGQLLTLARAMTRTPVVVVLDEATASVDPMTETLIQRAIDRILRLKTVLVVAHRLSTVRAADQIIVLEEGRVVETGTHTQLLEKKGRYATLHETQRAFDVNLLK